jgi:hypothetical protein
MDLLLQPGKLGRIREHTPTDRGAINHTVGLDFGPPALPEGRDQRFAIEQVVNDPVGRNRGGTEAPESFERCRLAGGDAPGQPDR